MPDAKLSVESKIKCPEQNKIHCLEVYILLWIKCSVLSKVDCTGHIQYIEQNLKHTVEGNAWAKYTASSKMYAFCKIKACEI